jgi:hypothetical protein
MKQKKIKFNNFKNEFQLLKNIDLKIFSEKTNKNFNRDLSNFISFKNILLF